METSKSDLIKLNENDTVLIKHNDQTRSTKYLNGNRIGQEESLPVKKNSGTMITRNGSTEELGRMIKSFVAETDKPIDESSMKSNEQLLYRTVGDKEDCYIDLQLQNFNIKMTKIQDKKHPVSRLDELIVYEEDQNDTEENDDSCDESCTESTSDTFDKQSSHSSINVELQKKKLEDWYTTHCAKRKRRVCYDYNSTTRNQQQFSFVNSIPAKVNQEELLRNYKCEMKFLRNNFPHILPNILCAVAKKKVRDSVHYIIHYLIKSSIKENEVINSKNVHFRINSENKFNSRDNKVCYL